MAPQVTAMSAVKDKRAGPLNAGAGYFAKADQASGFREILAIRSGCPREGGRAECRGKSRRMRRARGGIDGGHRSILRLWTINTILKDAAAPLSLSC